VTPIAFPKLTLPDPGSNVAPTLGHPLVDDYLESVSARLRPNSTLALSTIRRPLSTLAGFYAHLVALGELDHNPVQRGMPVRSPVTRDRRVIPLVRPVRHLPRILDHDHVIKLVTALRKDRDRAMIDAMLLAGLRRCEVLGLRRADVRWGERRLFIADGKGGHQRGVPISSRFFDTLRAYLDHARPADAETQFVFVVLKGRNNSHRRVMSAPARPPSIHARVPARSGSPSVRVTRWVIGTGARRSVSGQYPASRAV
jgi:site-specific recombinase XerC